MPLTSGSSVNGTPLRGGRKHAGGTTGYGSHQVSLIASHQASVQESTDRLLSSSPVRPTTQLNENKQKHLPLHAHAYAQFSRPVRPM